MASTPAPETPRVEPSPRQILVALAICLVFVAITRLPIARPSAFDFDETGYLVTIEDGYFPKQHTLFLGSARLMGEWLGNPYGGFLVVDAITSALAMASVWWMLRAIVAPRAATVATLIMGVGPVFWAYGAMAANYTAIPAVGAFLFGIAWRGRTAPKSWHPFAAAVVLALGAGYRQDIGLFWMPVLLVILWQHRGMAAMQAAMVFGICVLLWVIPVLRDAGGLANYRAETSKFARSAGYLNSIWNLGPIDATARYAFKAAMALSWTLGLGLLFVPQGIRRLRSRDGGWFLMAMMIIAAIPAMAMHLLVHFGVPGYAFHYLPALVVLMAVGLGSGRAATVRGITIAASLAALFLLYPTNYQRTGFRGDFDLSFARYTRVGLVTKAPLRDPDTWRTVISQRLPENVVPRPTKGRSWFSFKAN